MPDSSPAHARRKYRIYGVVVESAFALSSVETEEAGMPAAIGIRSATSDEIGRRISGLATEDEGWIRYGVLEDGSFYLRINDVLEAIVSADGRHVVAAADANAEARTFEASLINFTLSAAFTLQGEECLHCTALAFGDRAVGLLGQSGAGKSTLAARLLTDGATLITDDMLRVTFTSDGVLAHMGPHRLKLFEETAARVLPEVGQDGAFNRLSGKVMVAPAEAPSTDAPLPLAALIWLGTAAAPGQEGVSVRRLGGMELMKVLTSSTMVARYAPPERLGRQLHFVERVARSVPVHALDYKRDFRLLDSVVRELRRVTGL